MRIALITDGITPFVTGGMQRHSANLAVALTKAGASVTLVHCVQYGKEIPSEQEVNESLFNGDGSLERIIGLHFPEAGKIPGHYLRRSFRYSQQVFDLLDWKSFDFVYCKGFTGWYFMKQRIKKLELPPIGVKFHGYEMFQKLPSFKQKIEAFMLRGVTKWNNQNANVVFSYGGKITELITGKVGVNPKKVLEFTSGIHSEWIRTSEISPTNRIKFVFVGRNEMRKGVKELNQVIDKVLNDQIEFHFVGPIPKTFENTDGVYYHGEISDVSELREVLDDKDVLICPSHAEGMPNVILEAMARGLAVIATDVGAVEKLVSNKNGLLIAPRSVSQLELAILKFSKMSHEELFNMRNNSRKIVKENFIWDIIGARTLKAMKEYIN